MNFSELINSIIKKYIAVAFIWAGVVFLNNGDNIRDAFVNGAIWPVSVYNEYFSDIAKQEDKMDALVDVLEENTKLKRQLAERDQQDNEPSEPVFDPNAVPMD